MITRMVPQYIGEWLGDIDWSYDFSKHYGGYCCPVESLEDIVYRDVKNLWDVARARKKGFRLSVETHGYWHSLITVGMYDGWPYWTPTPAILYQGPLGGGEAHQFPCIENWKIEGYAQADFSLRGSI